MVTIPFGKLDYNIFNDIKAVRKPKGNSKGNKKKYADIIAAFDIETTKLENEQTIMYLWQFAIDDLVIYGRLWSEFYELLYNLKKRLKGLWVVIWDFNLSYEFQFLKGWYDFAPDEVFAVASRKVLKCEMFDAFEFRCAHLHSNMTLRKFLEKMGVSIQKGELDYNKRRMPFDALPPGVIEYGARDVAGLTEAIAKEMLLEKHNLYTLPLTSTGFVRLDAKEAMRSYNHKKLAAMMPDVETFIMLKKAFRGGDVHANRYFVGDIIENVKSKDIASSYPAIITTCYYPMTAFKPRRVYDLEDAEKHIYKYGRAALMDVIFYNLREKDPFKGRPYFSSHKCQVLQGAVLDNGRVMSAEICETVFTDIDYKIIKDCYVWDDAQVVEFRTAKYGRLPKEYIDVVCGYFAEKTKLKGDVENAYYYARSKESLNALYGMMAQCPVRDVLKFINGEFVAEPANIKKQLEKNRRRGFLNYSWGVYTTAHARARLWQGQKCVEDAGGSCIYWDTDCVKYIGAADFEAFNASRQAEAKKMGAEAMDGKGAWHYMGVFEDDGDYDTFKTLGCKRYAYTDSSGLHITIAGVSKSAGAKELKSLDNFKDGFIFNDSAGLDSIYNDDIDMIYSDGVNSFRYRDNITLKQSSYTLGLAGDYQRLLEGIYNLKYFPFDIENFYHS